MKLVLLILLVILPATDVTAADFTDFKAIAISSPLITQIYNNPELNDLEDIDLSSESQIKLYEDLSDDICGVLINRYEDKVDFLCYGDIQNRLSDTDSWNVFNRTFTGKNDIPVDISTDFADKLDVDGVLNSYLMFSYYKNSDEDNHLEVHFEWYLIDLASGESVSNDSYDCKYDIKMKSVSQDDEFDCFAGIIDFFGDK